MINRLNIMKLFTIIAVLWLLQSCRIDMIVGDKAEEHIFFQERGFDLEAHRGGMGLYAENTLSAFANALELGVSTLELDTHITKDNVVVVTHDSKILSKTCLDVAPIHLNDPMYPYVGKYIKDLTLEQVQSVDCGSVRQDRFPEQRLVYGAKIPTLNEVFELIQRYQADQVLLNIEIKFNPIRPNENVSKETFITEVLNAIDMSHMEKQVVIQSFDWSVLMDVKKQNAKLPLIALTKGKSHLEVAAGGVSPWLGGIDIDDFNGDVVEAILSFGGNGISPMYGDYYTTPDFIHYAHTKGLKVIPWTINDESIMKSLIEQSVDGMITDYPDRLRKVMQEMSVPLPNKHSL